MITKAEYFNGVRLIVPVRCYADDFIATNSGKTHEVYRKVFLTATAYKTAMKANIKKPRS
jgi:hypothetical protein